MKIYLGADHGGFELKEKIKVWLTEEKHDVTDFGARELNVDDDFVEPAIAVSGALQEDPEARGILLCRNGFGMSIVSNRFDGVRCGIGFDANAVDKGRTDDDINCLAIPADYVDFSDVKEFIIKFLKTEFSGEERYKRRLEKIEQLFAEYGEECCGGNCGCSHQE